MEKAHRQSAQEKLKIKKVYQNHLKLLEGVRRPINAGKTASRLLSILSGTRM